MTKELLLAATTVFTCIFAAIPGSSAQTATFSYNDNAGTPNAGTYAPGSSFTFAITLAFTPGGTVANLDGLTYFFEQQNPNAPFNFSITNRDVTGSQFTDLQTPGLTYPQSLTPSNASDLGAFLPGQTGLDAGSYFIANITVSVSPSAAPGTYFIENTTTGGKVSAITDLAGHTAAIPQAVYSITVVPEPQSLFLFTAGLALFALPGVRRRLGRP